MSERTPNTHTVRHGWIMGHPFPLSTDIDDRGAEFDSWLAEHDRQVAERAWDEAIEEMHALGWLHDFAKSDALSRNPHRAAKGEQK